jgi:hypothetical protein
LATFETRVYAPGAKRITHKIKGHVGEADAIKLTREELEGRIAAAQAMLATSDAEWRVDNAATGPAADVTANPDGSLTFDPGDEEEDIDL